MTARGPGERRSYEIGRQGGVEPYGLDTNEREAWQQGRKDRRSRMSPWPESGGGGGGAGLVGGILVLITLGAALAVAASAGIAAFASAALLYLLSRLWPGLPNHGYAEAYVTSFWCLAAFIALLAAPLTAAGIMNDGSLGAASFMAWVVEATPAVMDGSLTRLGALGTAHAHSYPPEEWLAWLERARPDADRIVTWAGILLFGPALLGAMIVAARRIEFRSAGAALAGSAAVSVLAILPGAAVAVSGLSWLVRHAQPADVAGIATLGKAALAGGVMVLAYAWLGAWVAGLVLYLVAKLARTGDPDGYGHAYRTAFRSLLTFGIVTVLAMFWFRRGDGLWTWAAAVAAAGPASLPAIDLATLWQATLASWPVIVPGLVVAAAIVSARHPSPFSGLFGYGGAIAVSAVTAVPLLVPCLVAGVELARRGLLD